MISWRALAAVRPGRLVILGWLVGCAVPSPNPSPPPAPKDLRSVSPVFLEEMIVRRKVSGVTMKIYNTGRVRTRGGAVSAMKSWDSRVRLDVPAFLIRHPVEGDILFDLGLSTRAASRMRPGLVAGFYVRYESAPGQDVGSQLQADGVVPQKVRWLLLSHLHLDHADSIDAFPQATAVVSRKEWEGQRARRALRRSSSEFDPAPYESRARLVDFSTAAPLGAFDRAVDLFSDGSIFLVDLPGHTEGSMGAWVNLDGGPVLLAGDAASVVDNYMDLALPVRREVADLDAYWRSLHQIRAMQQAAPRLVVFPGHDLTPRTLTTRQDLPLAPYPGP